MTVAIFVIIPGNQLHELGCEGNASLGVEDRTARVGDEVSGDNLREEQSENVLEDKHESFGRKENIERR